MKKVMFSLMILFVLLRGTTACAEERPYWQDFMDSAKLSSSPYTHFAYNAILFETEGDSSVSDGIEHNAELYVRMPNVETKTYFTLPGEDVGYLQHSIKYALLKTNHFALAGKTCVTIEGDQNLNYYDVNPEFHLLGHLDLNKNFSLQGDSAIIFRDGEQDKSLSAGLTLNMSSSQTLKLKGTVVFFDLYSGQIVLEGAYHFASYPTSYTFYMSKDMAEQNFHFENVIDLQATRSTNLTAQYTFNTDRNYYTDALNFKLSQHISRALSFTAGYKFIFDSELARSVTAGFAIDL